MSKIKTVTYWLTTIVIAAAFIITGIGNLVPFQHIAADMAHLGYPPYFQIILGIWKILAAVAILLPKAKRLKEWAYAGIIFDLTGAAFSRYSMGDEAAMVIIPLMIASLASASWMLRPKGRKLQSLTPINK
ncbi:MAG: DoxX family protein [Chitinophagaceae bacterium]|nr:DoxX family protein [Chitinophagaceae bacterium]MCB9047331.1 DoxX family protein [Chitinophagales bacterium]